MEVSKIFEEFSKEMPKFTDGENFKKCIQCGICGGSCPFGPYTEFTPRRMIAAYRSFLLDDVALNDWPWLCSSCNLCTDRCPSNIPITDALIPLLRSLSLNYGKPPDELAQSLMNISRFGNSFGESEKKRVAWTQEMNFPVKILRPGDYTDYLYIVDDFGSYDVRGKEITKSFAKIMHFLNTEFGIMGSNESTVGDLVRLSGEFGLFENIALNNIKKINNYKFDAIVTIDPHAFHSLKNVYPSYGFSAPVMHHTQFLENNLEKLKKSFKSLNFKVTFHDPCYLGRKNKIYDAPRKIIDAIPGIKRVEMERTRENSFCCGGGGGMVWMDSISKKYIKVRPAEERVQEAYDSGAEIMVTACPIDAIMFEDAVKVLGLEGKLRIMDIAELVLLAMEGEKK